MGRQRTPQGIRKVGKLGPGDNLFPMVHTKIVSELLTMVLLRPIFRMKSQIEIFDKQCFTFKEFSEAKGM